MSIIGSVLVAIAVGSLISEMFSADKNIKVVDEVTFFRAIKKLEAEIAQMKRVCASEFSVKEFEVTIRNFEQRWSALKQDCVLYKKEDEETVSYLKEIDSLRYHCGIDLSQVKKSRKSLTKKRNEIQKLVNKIDGKCFADEMKGIEDVCEYLHTQDFPVRDYHSIYSVHHKNLEAVQIRQKQLIERRADREKYIRGLVSFKSEGQTIAGKLNKLLEKSKQEKELKKFLELSSGQKGQYAEIEKGISQLEEKQEVLTEWNRISSEWKSIVESIRRKLEEIQSFKAEADNLNQHLNKVFSEINDARETCGFRELSVIDQYKKSVSVLEKEIQLYTADYDRFDRYMRETEIKMSEKKRNCIRKKDQEKVNYTEKCRSFLEEIDTSYIAWSDRARLNTLYNEIIGMYTHAYGELSLEETGLDSEIDFQSFCEIHNNAYIKQEMSDYREYFDTMLAYPLDEQQRIAIVSDEDYMQVIAGAGCGKTSTIQGKINYLVEKKGIEPEKILVLVFNNRAQKDLVRRISVKGIHIHTFHSFGNKIARTTGDHLRVYDQTDQKINSLINELIKRRSKKDSDFAKKLLEFSILYQVEPKSRYDFEKMNDYYRMLSMVGFSTVHKSIAEDKKIEQEAEQEFEDKQTLNGEFVRSYEELVIANYLFINGIKYEYERLFPAEEWGRNDTKEYTPDFYLNEYDLYWEHFGIGFDGKPGYLDEKGQKDYIYTMELKRERYRELGRKLIETYSWQFSNGLIYKYLEETLEEFGIQKNPIPAEKIVQILLERSSNRLFNTSKSLIESYLNLYKSRLLDRNDIFKAKQLVTCANDFQRKRVDLFFDVFEEIYDEYVTMLNDENKIDFNDMISIAIREINAQRFQIDYDYVIVDEYQDMSYSRHKLLEAVVHNGSGVKLFGVGDDWQSIYGFTGSDINFFVKFQDYWKHALCLKIEKTHRNSQELVDIAGSFVMKNPEQIKKRLQAKEGEHCPIKVIIYDDENKDSAIQQSAYRMKKAVSCLKKTYESGAKYKKLNDKDIQILCRNNETLDRMILALGKRYTYSTVHKSKGSEAEAVILADIEEGIAGFPNQMTDDVILQSLLAEPEKYQYAQERRLFYVALTRTKGDVIITTPQNKMSCFVKELLAEHPEIETIELAAKELGEMKVPVCKICGGKMKIRKNHFTGELFWGCSNYLGSKNKGCNYTQNMY